MEEHPDNATHATPYTDLHVAMMKNHRIYEETSGRVKEQLSRLLAQGRTPSAQDIEDALNMTCVSLGHRPLEAMVLVQEFLRNYVGLVEHGR